ncbi:hypothetical protein NDU88_007538 [Pleurodeles waltl]|uniref:Peptidase A2 domain-containing protein n=1 Tax=Pleurodeles waltl TaxID=8319 RepID=A0AAV7RTI8_PLEWA|nr:hypothetical protein NDU88_007538 [Pleurodeles waltl]
MCAEWPKSKSVAACEDRCELTDRIRSIGGDDNVVSDKRESRPKAWFTVQRASVELMVDTGSKYTIISKEVFMKNWPHLERTAKDICPGGYQGKEIEILGSFSFVICFKTRETFWKVYVAESGPPILGWMHQYDLNIIVNPRGSEQILIVDDVDGNVILEEVKEVFREELGELTGYVHKIRMKPGAVAVKHKVRKFARIGTPQALAPKHSILPKSPPPDYPDRSRRSCDLCCQHLKATLKNSGQYCDSMVHRLGVTVQALTQRWLPGARPLHCAQ